jgi:hypothetical protein
MKTLATAVVLAAALAACTDTTTASRSATQAPGVPIAVDSIAGAPETVRGSFTSALSSEATSRKVEIVDPATNPRYRIRGYLAAEPTADGQTALAFVWDVFDSQKRRAQRVQGATVARSSTGDWSGIDQTTVTKAASESMDQIAQFLVVQPQSVSLGPITGGAAQRARTAAAAASAATPTRR